MPKNKQRSGLQKDFAAIFEGVWVPKKARAGHQAPKPYPQQQEQQAAEPSPSPGEGEQQQAAPQQQEQPESSEQQQQEAASGGANGEPGADESRQMERQQAQGVIDTARDEELTPEEMQRAHGVAGVAEPREDW